VRVGDLDAEEDVEDLRQHGVSDPAVRRRHCASMDVTAEAGADHEVVSVLQQIDEHSELAQVVGSVPVGHDDEVPFGLGEPAQIGAPVPPPRLVDDARPRTLGDLGATVGRAIVDDNHLACPARAVDPFPGPVDDLGDRGFLVEARYDD